MCLSCGCGEPDDDHGNPGHTTGTDPREASTGGDTGPARAGDDVRPGTEPDGTPPS